ncbi:DUF3363 domain-containing protein [Pusillimonas sp. SM2304]|uniref:DUF3363 domain-containing protein n=1 Tax=Pusillimonas sp. SM2304 TaxID=3073241 RepID=UPI002875AC40|nr:DUF3363 domain-containing protein [Pusillimonas sp. SM2304]MDS1140404.1 DUF3363 domain-containing protein [Pusillimonas sp. SM2304]
MPTGSSASRRRWRLGHSPTSVWRCPGAFAVWPRPLQTPSQRVSGEVAPCLSSRRRYQLASRCWIGKPSRRYAMLDDGSGFTLVPWRPIVAQRRGESMSVSIEAGRATWEFGKQRGVAL